MLCISMLSLPEKFDTTRQRTNKRTGKRHRKRNRLLIAGNPKVARPLTYYVVSPSLLSKGMKEHPMACANHRVEKAKQNRLLVRREDRIA